MKLTQKNFDEIEQLLIPHLNTPAKREMAVLKIFIGTNKQPPHIDYTGNTQEACFWLVKALWDYGDIEPNEPALWFLLEYIKRFYPEHSVTHIEKLQNLILAYHPQKGAESIKSKQRTKETIASHRTSFWSNRRLIQIILIASIVMGCMFVLLAILFLTSERDSAIELTEETARLTERMMTMTPRNTIIPTATVIPTVSRIIAIERALASVQSNDEWIPYSQLVDNIEMVLVPSGCFWMGSENGDLDETPVHEICFGRPYWIDRYEVTASRFAEFRRLAGQSSNPCCRGNGPRSNITWFESRNYCEWRGARLPTEAEWEYAARGVDSLIYPWGNTYDDARLNSFGRDAYSGSAPVDAFDNGVSWVGAYQMSGNVWEWVSTIYDNDRFPYPYISDDGRENMSVTGVWRVLRGGSWNLGDFNSRAANRYYFAGEETTRFRGTRCARDFVG